jgi:RNA polymerase sigma factor (sigma-70 family)
MIMDGGEGGFDEVFDALYPRARTLAYRILGDMSAAEDAAAEAMTRTLVRWHRVGRMPHRDGWILRVTANVALDAARRRTRSTAALARLVPDQVGSVDDELVVLRAALVEALLQLPKRQREAVVLVHLLGFSPSDAAATMNVSVSSVGQHVRRGLERLRVDVASFPAPDASGAC